MLWDPLRHLTPLSEHPSISPSLSPALSDTTLLFLEVDIRLNGFRERHYAAWKILTAFLEFLEDGGKVNLASDILHSHDDEQLVFLANHLLDAVLKPFALAGGRSPSPLTTPPSQDAASAIDLAMFTIETSARAAQTALRNDCLRRDGYRCVFTGFWDINSVVKEIAHPLPTELQSNIECAHIIPFALGIFDESDAVQTRNKAIIWFCIHRYFPQIQHKIDARSINQRSNAISLQISLHKTFGDYLVAFSPQDHQHPNAVELITVCDDPLFVPPSKSGSSKVQFTSADNNIPMPDPNYLKVHQSISQILQVSGFGRVISLALEDSWLALDCRGLHPDGTTDVSALLSNLLLTNVRAGPTEGKDPSHRKPSD